MARLFTALVDLPMSLRQSKGSWQGFFPSPPGFRSLSFKLIKQPKNSLLWDKDKAE